MSVSTIDFFFAKILLLKSKDVDPKSKPVNILTKNSFQTFGCLYDAVDSTAKKHPYFKPPTRCILPKEPPHAHFESSPGQAHIRLLTTEF